MRIIFQKKNNNDNTNNNNMSYILKKESLNKLKNIINNLKLSSEYNNIHNMNNMNDRESNSKNSKKEINIKSNKSKNNKNKKIKDNNKKKLPKSNSCFIDSKIVKENKDINKYLNLNEKDTYTNRNKNLYNNIYNNNEKIKNYNYLHTKRVLNNNDIKNKYNKHYNINKIKNIKKTKKVLSRDGFTKLLRDISSKNITSNYSDNYKKLFSRKNKIKLKNISSNTKIKNKSIIIDDNINKKIENYINSNKIITVNLNNSNMQIKKNKNKIKINTHLINSISPQNYNINDNLNKTQTQIIFSPLSSIFTQTHENSLAILSTKNINKKENITYRDYPKLSIESSNKFKYNNNLQEMTQESSELNVIVDSMKNQINQFKNININNTSFYLNGERNFFCSPDGPEDFHFRFVELCKQNKNYFRKIKINTSNNKDKNNIKENEIDIDECQEYFENFGDNVPYI